MQIYSSRESPTGLLYTEQCVSCKSLYTAQKCCHLPECSSVAAVAEICSHLEEGGIPWGVVGSHLWPVTKQTRRHTGALTRLTAWENLYNSSTHWYSIICTYYSTANVHIRAKFVSTELDNIIGNIIGIHHALQRVFYTPSILPWQTSGDVEHPGHPTPSLPIAHPDPHTPALTQYTATTHM